LIIDLTSSSIFFAIWISCRMVRSVTPSFCAIFSEKEIISVSVSLKREISKTARTVSVSVSLTHKLPYEMKAKLPQKKH
jgi:hypothetical protein